jgi:hypothetical protein
MIRACIVVRISHGLRLSLRVQTKASPISSTVHSLDCPHPKSPAQRNGKRQITHNTQHTHKLPVQCLRQAQTLKGQTRGLRCYVMPQWCVVIRLGCSDLVPTRGCLLGQRHSNSQKKRSGLFCLFVAGCCGCGFVWV